MPRIGFFGKLPARGDFLTRGVPPEVLTPWEKWLEAAMGGARQQLGQTWSQVYERASVWRFWIGGGLLGAPMTGVLAPSVDRVGRCFPLTFVLTGPAETLPAPPLVGSGNADWYVAMDRAAIEARHPRFEGDVDGLLERLPLPKGARYTQAEDRRAAFFAYGEAGLDQLIEDVRSHDHQLTIGSRSYWWTAGNDFSGPAMVALNGMPDAHGFAALLTGFGPPVRQAPEASDAPDAVIAASQAWEAFVASGRRAEAAQEAAPSAQQGDLGWAATTPPTEVSQKLRDQGAERAALSMQAASVLAQEEPPAFVSPNVIASEAEEPDAPQDAREDDPDRQVPEPTASSAQEDPWAIAVPESAQVAPTDMSDSPPTPETSAMSDPWGLVQDHGELEETDTHALNAAQDEAADVAEGPETLPSAEPPDDTALRYEDLPEEEDSPFGVAAETPDRKRKSLRGLFSRR